MSIKFNGALSQTVTFKAAESITPNTPVSISANETVIGGRDSSLLAGICVNCRNGLAGVQLRGYAELPYTSSSPSVGAAKLACDGKGGVKTDPNGRECIVVKVDTASKIIGFFM